MAQELPFFRFSPQQWQNGDIAFEDYAIQGLFINICSVYWVKSCSITLAMLEKRFSNDRDNIAYLIEANIIKFDPDTDFIEITFLDEQFDMLSDKRNRRQEAGRLGGAAKSSNAKAMLEQKGSNALAKGKERKGKERKGKDIKEKEEISVFDSVPDSGSSAEGERSEPPKQPSSSSPPPVPPAPPSPKKEKVVVSPAERAIEKSRQFYRDEYAKSTDNQKEHLKRLGAFLKENDITRVLQMKDQASAVYLEKLVAEFGWDLIKSKLLAMENSAELLTKNISAKLTLRNWLGREKTSPLNGKQSFNKHEPASESLIPIIDYEQHQ